jgi:hypothetical protein
MAERARRVGEKKYHERMYKKRTAALVSNEVPGTLGPVVRAYSEDHSITQK